MVERIDELLRLLRDVEGVIGSFVWSKSGALLGRDLPARFDDEVLGEVGQRIARIYEAFEGAGDELDRATLVFAGSKLHLREVDSAFIAVLAQPHVHEPALTMAMHVLGRAVYGELEALVPAANRATPPAGKASVGPAVRAARPPVPAHVLRSRLQRGKRAPD